MAKASADLVVEVFRQTKVSKELLVASNVWFNAPPVATVTGLIRYLNQDADSLAARLSKAGVSDATFDSVKAAEESCRIVAKPSFYPGRLVDARYIEEYTPVMEQRLTVAGARLASLLNGLFH